METALASLLGAMRSDARSAGQGVWVAELGAEESLDISAAATSVHRTFEMVKSWHEELFGFTLLVSSLPPSAGTGLDSRARDLLAAADREDQLWLSPECAVLFSNAFAAERFGDIFLVTSLKRGAPQPIAQPEQEPRTWLRESLIVKALELVTPRLNTGETREILYLHGPSGAGKTTVIREIARRLLCDAAARPRDGAVARPRDGSQAVQLPALGAVQLPALGDVPLLRMHTLFKRRSPLHPFLNSLVPSILQAVPGQLRGPERAAWEEVGGVLTWLRMPFPTGGAPADAGAGARPGDGGEPLPDHLLEDFTIGYKLYIQAWVRMAAARSLPAILACEGVESYHPEARTIIARLFDDMLSCPDFLPMVSSIDEQVPQELAALDFSPLYVHPLGKREIRSLSRHLFPGLSIPESVVRRLRARSGGLYVSVVSYLQYLWKTGRIREVGGGHEWVQSTEDEIALPANPLSVSWFLIKSLQDDTFLLLYALYLAGGLLDRQAFLAFLAESGFDLASVERTLAGLLVSGLMSEEESLIPRFPALRKKLEELLGAEGARLRERFVVYMFSLWSAGRYRHLVLLFTFLAKSGRTDLALRVLPDLIRRKLDEGDVQGALAFCDARRMEFSVAPTPAEEEELAVVTALGRLRSALLQGGADDAFETARELERRAAADHGSVARDRRTGIREQERARTVLRGHACIERAKYFLSVGDSQTALDELKKALLAFQETRDDGAQDGQAAGAEGGERAAYLWLGATMLADGRFRDAVEYLGLSERPDRKAQDAPGTYRASTYLAICHFIDGRFSQSLAAIERARLTARTLCRRELELFLEFLRSRVLFTLGDYGECVLGFQRCLCLATLYSIAPAAPVLRSWLGRSLVYMGGKAEGIRLLEMLEQTREVLFFLAEGALFNGNIENAMLYVERALAMQDPAARFPPPEGTSWDDGFCAVEGRCFRLSRGGPYLRRSLEGLRGYLLAMRGFRDEGIRELHRLTRGSKSVDEDPGLYWYNYLYSLALPEATTDEMDDKATVLSKSLKTLQERASRIDTPSERSSFLMRSLWNKRIMDDARERKLV